MLIPIQKALVQTFKYSPLLVLVVLGLNQHGLLRFISKLLAAAVQVEVQKAGVQARTETLEAVGLEAQWRKVSMMQRRCLAH
jgi:hypothetical protein